MIKKIFIPFLIISCTISCHPKAEQKTPAPPVPEIKKMNCPVPVLNARGEYWLYQLNWNLGADDLMAVSTEQLGNDCRVRIDLDNCIVIGLDRNKQLGIIHRLFIHGLENQKQFSGISVYTDKKFFYTWKPTPEDLKNKRADMDTIRSYAFFTMVRTSDTTYTVFKARAREEDKNGKEIKTRYLANCINDEDTLQILFRTFSWKSEWRMKYWCGQEFIEGNRGVFESNEKYLDPEATKIRIELAPDSSFCFYNYIKRSGKDMLQVTAGKYRLVNDSLLYLNSTAKKTKKLLEQNIGKINMPGGMEPFFVMNKLYLLRDNRLYFVNPNR